MHNDKNIVEGVLSPSFRNLVAVVKKYLKPVLIEVELDHEEMARSAFYQQ